MLKRPWLKFSDSFIGLFFFQMLTEFCKTCHTCQITGKPCHVILPASLHAVPAAEEPFSKVILDCVGPLLRTKTAINIC